ncbi:hypothetical protein ABB37_09322 [Leptomonas pyrrhocoris]|uniref:Dynein heavy chain linker domain-containing protein n=1 Tax=Leptomonas pyrrhocoris TaxID=157538 RepID=A0A0M9FRE7_LEPPY|nr:hypothetical protein ABB37_09322 [Leptomonas pyrrhocoris]XP_015652775.1 hypothetical protein ABB37_09322 [Leptomonas pyrrhocoris]KPA74335.1 hypothetical protein ABB37_09322 [Leptomonas pyrrhocoris]KPA74336.1 hypothetical protein ABB37_09322 [Leptomonas pyrrhocoris]|eukprot:XP_015652774.1 hypothetical protein ABB37_09322 [Leptomonas pyrrhocoris]
MSTKANQEKVEGRFDKVLSYYWDGIPVPLISDAEKICATTFVCRQLAFTPDYHGETVNIPLTEPLQATLFSSLAIQSVGPQPASSRIGSHYSPYVGLFRFTEDKQSLKDVAGNEKSSVRVPVEYCEKDDGCAGDIFAAHCRVRTGKLVALYKPLIKEHLPLSRNSLRNIIILSSRGCTSISREVIAGEISDVNEAYATALSEAIFYYMCLNPLQRRILGPLQLATEPEGSTQTIQDQFFTDKTVAQQHFNEARQQLKKQLFWNASTHGYFAALQSLWESKFDQLLLLNTDAFTGVVEVSEFISRISNSITSIISRIRIEFFTNVEEFFYSFIPNAKDALLISEEEYEDSVFRRIFVATEVFLVYKLRSLVFDGLDSLVAFFDCGGCGSTTRLSKRAQQDSFIRLDLLTGELSQPRAPALAVLLFGIRDLFTEIENGVNNLPNVGCVILRTLKLKQKKIVVLSHVEVASYRASIAHILNDVTLIIDGILTSYKAFCSIPAQNVSAVKTGSHIEVAKHVGFARQQMTDIFRASWEHMYCGRFEVNCVTLQATLAHEWKNYMSALTSAYQKEIISVVDNAKKRSSIILKVFDTIPSNVEDLEVHQRNTEAAIALARELRSLDCKEILNRVACMEELRVPIEQDVCKAVFDFMKLPEELIRGAEKAGDVRTRCAPSLQRKLNQLRTSTQAYMKTLSTGVTELYHLFNLETCDIAAQTCTELRELVDRIDANLQQIAHEEQVLGISAEDTFDNFPSLLHYFEVVEQFWNSIFDATKLRNLYNSPISSVNATASVEKVREWRRLIHSSSQHLRGFPLLTQLGREQEVALSKYEELELFLEVISSPNLRKNHWKDIAKLIAGQLREDVASVIDLSVTVKRLLNAGLMEHMGPLGQIANQAQCDYEVESALEEMRSYGKRTHFVLEDSHDSGVSRTSVAQRFIYDASAHVEEFVTRCWAMRRYPNLGQLVQRPLLEWKFSCEKSCEMLSAFESVQESCAWVENYLHTLRMSPNEKGKEGSSRQAIIQHLSAASDAVKRLHTTLRKPQFSLYTAIVQETIQDVFFAVKAAADDVLELLRRNLHQRRAAFPRFYFLSDNQLLSFQFVLAPQSFVPFLPCLYSHLADVEIADGDVKAVVTADGASLPLMSPISLAATSPDAWLAQFDLMVRRSLLLAVKNCVAAYYRTDLETWVSAWCGQVAVLALRILHTESIRHAVQIGGDDALRAYARRISDVCCALSQLAVEAKGKRKSGHAGSSSVEATIRAALAYEQFALQEVKLVIEWRIHNVADLDCTQLVQTFCTPSGDSIQVSFMGVSLEYGLEFLGHGGPLFMSSSLWKQMVMVLADMELGRSVPLVCGKEAAEVGNDVLKTAAEVLGRFYVRVELTSQTLAETLVPVLRGCIETGAFLCLANCETASPEVLSSAVLPLVQAYLAATPSTRWELSFGPSGALLGIPVHPFFRLAFSSGSPGVFPLQISTLCDTVRITLPDVTELMHRLLTQAGVISIGPFSVQELELAELYEQLKERAPDIFTIQQLCVVIHDLIAQGAVSAEDENAAAAEPSSLSLQDRFLKSLLRTSYGAFQGDEGARLRESLTEQIQAQLLLPNCKGVVPPVWTTVASQDRAQTTCDEGVQRFATLIELHRRVLITGPRFSGKTELWRKWVGGTPSLILSPQFMTASELYGSATQKGYLSQMVSQISLTKAAAKARPIVVLEDVDAPSSFQIFAQTWFDGRRTPEGVVGGTCVVPSPNLCVIATAVEVRHITPGVIDGFAMLALTSPSCWKGAIKWALRSVPEGEAARKVLEVLLPPLVDRAAKMSPGIVGSASELTNMCAIAQRAASLCSRWYAYALTIRTHSDVLAPREDDDEVDLRLFAARCAVMAASWSVGLSLPSEDRDTVKLTLLSAEADVVKALAGSDVSGEVFPELTYSSISPLEQVVLPQGWMSFDDAAKRTDLPLSWSGYRNVNPQLQVSLQVLTMPSRLATLRSMECLMNCGQHVLLHAGAVNGKTTLLHTMRTCENWVTQVFQMNAGFNATEMQQTMAGTLSKRCNGRYGPLLGRRLVVCVDDLHLSPATAYGDCAPLAGCFMSYCAKFRAISTPALGTVPTTDVVFCATTLLHALSHERGSIGAFSGCVDVLLPLFNGDEIANGLLQISDMASSRKRAKGFPQECAAFLGLIHGVYCQLSQRRASLASNSGSFSLSSAIHVAGGAPPDSGSPTTISATETNATDSSAVTLQGNESFFFTEHFRALLEAAEVVRVHLLSAVSDSQVSARVFIGLTTFYDELLSPSANMLSADTATWSSEAAAEQEYRRVSHEFRNSAVQAAEGTLRNSVHGSVEFRNVAKELPETLLRDAVSAANEARVAHRIACFPDALEEEEETDLSSLGDQRKGNVAKRTYRSGATVRSETRHSSVLLSYPDSLKIAMVRAEESNRDVYIRRSSSTVGASVRSSRRASSVGSAASETSSVSQHRSPSVMVTPTYQTTWLTTRLVHLADTLSAPGTHLLFLGDNTFGMRRLFRLWCASSHVPFMWFRVNPADAPRDAISTFVAELRATITYVCRESVHAVAYVPPPLLRTPEVLRIMDALVRSGDVSSLFTDEERFGLLNGPAAVHSRSLKPFVFVDDSPLRKRLLGSLNFVFHLYDATEARQLGKGYPFLLQSTTTALPLHTEALERSLLEEMALGILHRRDAHTGGIRRMEDEDDAAYATAVHHGAEEEAYGRRLTPRAACTALCAAFDHVRKTYPTSVEQFLEFVRLYKELDKTARVQVLASARTGKIIAGRGDEAVQAVNAGTQRSRVIVEELAAMQVKLALLTETLEGQEREHGMRAAEAERSREALTRTRDAVQKQRDAVTKGLESAMGEVAKSLRQLRRAKTGIVRALGMSRVPDKGTLLVRALYAVLGEEVPKHNDNANELWSLSMRRMCTKEFTAQLAKTAPENSIDRLPALLPFHRELDVVRYGPALPYAQLLADFVVAWVRCVRFMAEDYTAGKAEIARAQHALEQDESVQQQREEEVGLAEEAAVQTRREVQSLQKSLAALQEEQSELAGGESRLLKYTGFVDRFTRFLIEPATVAERVKRAQCVVGDTLFVAAFYSLLAMHGCAQSMSASLQEVLTKTVQGTTLRFSSLSEVCTHLLFQTHAPKTEVLLVTGCNTPWEYKALMLSLYQRRASRWTLVGGAGPVAAYELLKFLAFYCTGSVSVSAADPLVKERLAAAMRAGEGVLLCDVQGSAAVDLVRSLNPVYQRLKEYHKSLLHRPLDTKGSGGGNTDFAAVATAAPLQMQSTTKKPFMQPSKGPAARSVTCVWFDGHEVRVHPQFFLVCTCWPVITSGLQETCASLDVFNLHTPLNHDLRLEWLLYDAVKKPSVSTKVASMQEEVRARQNMYFNVIQLFANAHDSAAALLAVDLSDISSNARGDALLAEMEQALAQVDTHDAQMTTTTSYVQSLQRTLQEGWDAILPAMKAVARATEQIEANRLGRPWNASGLDNCIADIANPSPALLQRIAPLSFSDLPIGQKCYYALALFIQRVVELLGPGWPTALKGMFSLSILCTAMSAAPATFAAESKLPMLTEGQRSVLERMVYDSPTFQPAEPAGKATPGPELTLPSRDGADANAKGAEDPADVVRNVFTASGDALLRRLASAEVDVAEAEMDDSFNAGGETAYDVTQLFTALLELDVEQASDSAGALYNTFMGSVTGFCGGSNRTPTRPSAQTSPLEGPRPQVTGQQYNSAMNDSELEGGASSGRTVNDVNEISVPHAELPTVDAHIQRAVKAHLPLCLVSKSLIEDTLMWLQSEVRETKWVFQWQELVPPSSVLLSSDTPHDDVAGALQRRAALRQSFEKAMQRVVSLARASCEPDTCGVCLTFVVDVKADSSVSAVAASDVLLFKEEFQRLLSLYSATSLTSASRGAAPTLCLTVICSAAAQHVIWGQVAAETSAPPIGSYPARCGAETVPCCCLSLSTYTPQLALADLLRPSRRFFTKDGAMQICDVVLQQVQNELDARTEHGASAETRKSRVRGPALARLTSTRGTATLTVPLPELPPDLSRGALVALRKAVSELRLCARLLHYEMMVAYAASTARLHLLYVTSSNAENADADAQLFTEAEQRFCRGHVYDPAPLLKIHILLSEWVRRRYGDLVVQLGGPPKTEVATLCKPGSALLPATATAATRLLPTQLCSPLTPSLPARLTTHRDLAEEHLGGYGMQAYYFLRRNQPAWGLLLQKAECQFADAAYAAESLGNAEATVDLLNPPLCSLMRAAESRKPEEENAHPANRPISFDTDTTANGLKQARQHRQKCQIEDASSQWKAGLFVMARKFALHYLCGRHKRICAGSTDCSLPLLEQRAQWDMLRTFIGATDDSEEVSFLWGPLAGGDYVDTKRWHELRISVRHLDFFRSEVVGAPSDLMELCAEERMIGLFRAVRQRNLLQLCFSPLVCAMLPRGEPAESANAGAAAGQEVHKETDSSQQEDTFALSALLKASTSAREQTKSTVTLAETVLGWEGAFLDACATHPAALNSHFQRMVQSFTSIIAPWEGTASVPPESTDTQLIHLWLPALQHPLLDLHYLTSAALGTAPKDLANPSGVVSSLRAPCSCRSGEDPFANSPFAEVAGSFFVGAREFGAVATALVVMVTEQRFLSPSDVVLDGAQLSPSLLRQIRELTGRGRGTAEKSSVDTNTEPVGRTDAAAQIVIAVRRVLLRRNKAKIDGALSDVNLSDALSEDDSTHQISVEVGMRVRCADQLSPGLIWCSAVWPQAAAEGALWDTNPDCRPRYTAPTSRSLSTAHSGSISREVHHTSESVFVTEVEDRRESHTPRAADGRSAVHTWSFSDVPIPVRWNSVRRGAAPGAAELPLCVEYDQPCPGGLVDPIVYVKDKPLTAEDSAGNDGVVGNIFLLQDALDAYVWIA